MDDLSLDGCECLVCGDGAVDGRRAIDLGCVLAIAVGAYRGLPDLLAVCRIGRPPGGADMNWVAEGVLFMLDRTKGLWEDRVNTQVANVVAFDLEGGWDHAHPILIDGKRSAIQWSPVVWPGTAHRSDAAFKGVFGLQAMRAMVLRARWLKWMGREV